MSIIATAVRHLMAAGVTGDALLTAIEELEAEVRAEPKPRSAGAIRQERYRERKRNEASQVTVSDASDADPALSPSPNEKISNPHPHTHPEGVNAPARKREAFPRPEGVDPQHWTDFLANRKRKRLANTPTAHKRLLDDLARFADDEWPPGRLVEHAAARGWAAIFDPRPSRNPTNDQQSASNDEIRNPYVRVAMRNQARREAERSGAEFG